MAKTLAKAQRGFYFLSVGSREMHRTIDRISAAQDRLIAARLRRNPGVLRLARSNLRRWAAGDRRHVRTVFQEWHAILYRPLSKEPSTNGEPAGC